MIRSIGIVSKPERTDIPALLGQLLGWCEQRQIDVAVDTDTASYLERQDGLERDELPECCDLIVVLGGDGTLLSVARAVGPREIPLLAVNLGGLGFMMTTGPDEMISVLDGVLAGDFKTDSRMMLEAHLVRDGESIDRLFALNDVVAANSSVVRLLDVEAYVDAEFVCSYRCDGLIIATPTGSTAYSLSAGGPVMYSSVPGICLTPICPHSLSNRSIVLPESARIELRFSVEYENNYLSVDGQIGRPIKPHDLIRAFKAEHTVKIVHPRNLRYFDLLRSKMDLRVR